LIAGWCAVCAAARFGIAADGKRFSSVPSVRPQDDGRTRDPPLEMGNARMAAGPADGMGIWKAGGRGCSSVSTRPRLEDDARCNDNPGSLENDASTRTAVHSLRGSKGDAGGAIGSRSRDDARPRCKGEQAVRLKKDSRAK
jgi:hypothetical protein